MLWWFPSDRSSCSALWTKRSKRCPSSSHVLCHRRGSRGRSTTSTTPRGLTLESQNPRPPSSTSSLRSGSPARWEQNRVPQWCTAALGLDARGPSPWWTPAWSWWDWGGVRTYSRCWREWLLNVANKALEHSSDEMMELWWLAELWQGAIVL